MHALGTGRWGGSAEGFFFYFILFSSFIFFFLFLHRNETKQEFQQMMNASSFPFLSLSLSPLHPIALLID